MDTEQAALDDAWAFLAERRPERYRYRGQDAFVLRGEGNLYFWYYGSLASFRRGGDTWKRWNAGMRGALLPSQGEDGSWEPISVYADYAGDDADDRSYTTALSVLTLEVYYRYFTPLLSVRAGGEAANAAPPVDR